MVRCRSRYQVRLRVRQPMGWLSPRRVTINAMKQVKIVSSSHQSSTGVTPLSRNNLEVLCMDGVDAPSRRVSQARLSMQESEESDLEIRDNCNTDILDMEEPPVFWGSSSSIFALGVDSICVVW